MMKVGYISDKHEAKLSLGHPTVLHNTRLQLQYLVISYCC